MKFLLFFASLLLIVSNSYSQTWPVHNISHDAGGSPSAIGDCDNDGDNDIIYYEETGFQISVLENLDHGNFASDEHFSYDFTDAGIGLSYFNWIQFEDVDGDNLGDLIVFYHSDTSNTRTIGWLKNNGNLDFGNFTPLYVFESNIFAAARVHDYDSDGDPDLAVIDVTSLPSTEILLLENTGTGSYSTTNLGGFATAPNLFYAPYFADKDNDSDIDIIYDQIWFENSGSGFSQHNFSYFIGPTEVFSFINEQACFYDFNNDGFIDLLSPTVVLGEETLYLTLGDLSGDFTLANSTEIAAPAVGLNLERYTYKDIDGDLDVDIIAFHNDFGELGFGWYENFGNGTFSTFTELFFMNYDNGLCLVNFHFEDLTDDGLNDLFISSTHEVMDAYMENLGSAQFDRFVSVMNFDRPVKCLTADFNGDEKNEVITTGWENLTLSVYQHHDQGIFGNHLVLFPLLQDLQYSFLPDTLDFDNDGDLDLLIGYKGGTYESNLAFYQNNNGNMDTYVFVDDSLDHINDMDVIDFDYDGFNDILITTTHNPGSTGSTDNSVILFTNTGFGTFVRDTLIINSSSGTGGSVSQVFTNISAADFNADGYMDFVIGGNFDENYHWFENDGSGNFVNHQVANTTTGIDFFTRPDLTEVTDIDQDGDMDILVKFTDIGGAPAFIYKNNGSGLFSESLITLTALGNLDHADFDLDGDIDILLQTPAGLEWFINSNGDFTSSTLVCTNVHVDVCLDDLNDDGYPDIIATSEIGMMVKTVVWYEGGATFTASLDELNSLHTAIPEIYPNPVNSDLMVRSETNYTLYQILDMSGRVISEGTLMNNSISVLTLENGTYILKLKTSDGSDIQKKFIKR